MKSKANGSRALLPRPLMGRLDLSEEELRRFWRQVLPEFDWDTMRIQSQLLYTMGDNPWAS